MTTYQELKQSHSKDIDNFEGIFFAFNQEQFKEGMEKVGLTVSDTKSIYSLGAGGYIRKDKSKDFENMLERHTKERQELKKEEKTLLSALVYELQNHEYCISGDTEPALNALGFTKDEIDSKLLNRACRLAV